jgi:hypothetical protein
MPRTLAQRRDDCAATQLHATLCASCSRIAHWVQSNPTKRYAKSIEFTPIQQFFSGYSSGRPIFLVFGAGTLPRLHGALAA